jgi:hypothetical protein
MERRLVNILFIRWLALCSRNVTPHTYLRTHRLTLLTTSVCFPGRSFFFAEGSFEGIMAIQASGNGCVLK